MRTDFDRERDWWNAKAAQEERDEDDSAINRALRWRELERHLDGARTILDVGAGTGAFSIPLARRGFEVTHFDLSPAMLALAREKARDLPNLRFAEGNATDLPFPDRAFDLVLNMDGAVSFCGAEAEAALREACRVTRRTLVVTASNRALLFPVTVRASVNVTGRLLPAVYAMLERGEWHQHEFADNHLLSAGCTQDYLGCLKAFTPGELRAILVDAGLTPVRVGGIGSLVIYCGADVLARVQADPELLSEFLDLCESYDAELAPDGPGTRQRAGLIAIAQRDPTVGSRRA